jgi:hypothetical protein
LIFDDAVAKAALLYDVVAGSSGKQATLPLYRIRCGFLQGTVSCSKQDDPVNGGQIVVIQISDLSNVHIRLPWDEVQQYFIQAPGGSVSIPGVQRISSVVQELFTDTLSAANAGVTAIGRGRLPSGTSEWPRKRSRRARRPGSWQTTALCLQAASSAPAPLMRMLSGQCPPRHGSLPSEDAAPEPGLRRSRRPRAARRFLDARSAAEGLLSSKAVSGAASSTVGPQHIGKGPSVPRSGPQLLRCIAKLAQPTCCRRGHLLRVLCMDS